jgi:hypothetical protein
MKQTNLYDQDFYLWTQRTAAQLRARQFDEIDIDNTAEEIESLGRNDRNELNSRLAVLLQHLLKWQFQPDKRSRSWQATIEVQRRDISKRLEQSPSLRPSLPDEITDCYPHARNIASIETGIWKTDFPNSCPWTVEDILDPEFWPGEVETRATQ